MKIASVSLATLALCASQSSQAVGLISLVDLGLGAQSLNSFDSSNPAAVTNIGPVTGLEMGESLLGIDFRPATGQLFGLGSANNLYTVDTVTGAASIVGTGFSTVTLGASAYGFDFNPVIDRIRIVGSSDQSNNVGNPDTGDATTVTSVFYGPGDANEMATPNLVHHAYTNSVAGAMTTQLYAIDSDLNILVTQANSAGTLSTVGSLGIDIDEVGGFDIDPSDGTAYAALSVGGESKLYTINLMTGAATEVAAPGVSGNGTLVAQTSGLAVVPEPSSALLLGLGSLALLRRRRN